jgi:hypothetical protein
MEEREHPRVTPDLEVFDVDGHKVGSVAHVYELQPGAADSAAAARADLGIAGITTTGGATGGMGLAGDGAFELKTGLFGLGKHYYIPFSAVKDVTSGGVFLDTAKADFDAKGWHTKPDFVEHPEQWEQAIAPASGPASAQPETGADAAPMDWETARSHYRSRWTDRYGAQGAQWETYEPRYRFAWDASRRPENQGRSWVSVQPELRDQWEALHPDLEWDTVADTVRDAWENPPTAARRAGAGATSAGR